MRTGCTWQSVTGTGSTDAPTVFFVTEGIHAALDQARAAAGDHDLAVAGGASTVNQYLTITLVTHVTYRARR